MYREEDRTLEELPSPNQTNWTHRDRGSCPEPCTIKELFTHNVLVRLLLPPPRPYLQNLWEEEKGSPFLSLPHIRHTFVRIWKHTLPTDPPTTTAITAYELFPNIKLNLS